MPISGLVLSLTNDAVMDDLVVRLSTDPRIDVGASHGKRLPVVLDTADSAEDRELWRWIRSQPGVCYVDVSFIHFDEPRPGGVGRLQEPSSQENDQA